MPFRAIHQLAPYLARGDAMGDHVLALRRRFRTWGYDSEIFSPKWLPSVAGQVQPPSAYARYSHPNNLLILHYAAGSETTEIALGLPDCLVLYYHNITPAHFYLPFNGEIALQLEDGRRDLACFAGRTPAIAASPYNGRELAARGIEVIGIVPYAFALEQHAAGESATPQPLSRFAKPGSTDWLHVGRLVPNKCLEDVIKAFYYYHDWINPVSRLLLVGNGVGVEHYVGQLSALIARLGLTEAVVFTGQMDQPAPFYRMARVYVTMSEHEGFCVPLLEAMQHGLPIVAYASSAVPETLGGAGVLIRRKVHALIAEIVNAVLTDEALGARLVAGQRARLAAYTPERASASLRACIDQLEQRQLGEISGGLGKV